MNGLILHCGAEEISRENLKNLPIPDSTNTHFPVEHHRFVDLTERAVHNTKLRFKYLGLKSFLKIDNAENLSFDDNSFDAIYSWGVLHHSPDTKKCFEELFRVLMPGGFAKIMIYHKHSPVGCKASRVCWPVAKLCSHAVS